VRCPSGGLEACWNLTAVAGGAVGLPPRQLPEPPRTPRPRSARCAAPRAAMVPPKSRAPSPGPPESGGSAPAPRAANNPRGPKAGVHRPCRAWRITREGARRWRAQLAQFLLAPTDAVAALVAEEQRRLGCLPAPPPIPLRTNRTRRVPHPVLIGHAASPASPISALRSRARGGWLRPPTARRGVKRR
jgi:hypothetical protein